MTCSLVFYYTATSGSSSFNRDITKDLSGGFAVSFGSVIYSNGDKWSDVDVTYDDGTVERVALIRNNSSTHTATNLRLVGCDLPEIEYDCINGACTKKDKYETPGLYKSLEECEVACGTGCSGKCLSNKDWQQIQNLSSQIKNKACN